MNKGQDLREIAEVILQEVGAIGCCDMHSDFHYLKPAIDKNQIYANATNNLKKQYPEQTDYKAFHEQINRVLEEIPATSADECPYCQKLLNE